MDFVSICLFTILLYVRPQEIFGFLESFRPAFTVLAMGFVALLTRQGGLNPRTILRTPHDWVMAAYFLWIIFTNDEPYETWKQIYPFVGFYFITVQALTSIQRVYTLLVVLMGCIMFVAVMALAQLAGIDPVDSISATQASNGRLVFNTTLFENPNALGHSVVVAIPLIYFLLVFRRPFFIKEVAIPLFALAVWCVYLTESKGSFISGFAAILATLVFGRPRWLQILIVAFAFTAGPASLQLLPRFGELETGKARKDEAIQGRVGSFKFGQETTEQFRYGVGYNNFYRAYVRAKGEQIAISSHSSFNQIATELGKGGLLLFVGLMYVSLRTLGQAKTSDDGEERIRRALFCLIVSYAISGWMIDFGFRAVFFVMIAMTGAFHRHLQSKLGLAGAGEQVAAALPREINPVPAMATAGMAPAQTYLAHMRQLRGAGRRGAGTAMSAVAPLAPLSGSVTTQQTTAYAPAVANAAQLVTPGSSAFIAWTRLGWKDYVAMYLFMRLALYIRVLAIERLGGG